MSGTLVLDNYDSFTFNLVHLLRELQADKIEVRRNDRITLDEAAGFDRILLSPGPGIPLEAGIMPELVKALSSSRPILGVCLGHQCIGEVFGAKLRNLQNPVHGKALLSTVIDRDEPLFQGLPEKFKTGRYHSWVVDRQALPDSLVITAIDDQGEIMALRHRQHDVRGVQFHPESILTEHGARMIKSWLIGGAQHL